MFILFWELLIPELLFWYYSGIYILEISKKKLAAAFTDSRMANSGIAKRMMNKTEICLFSPYPRVI
jgi:hypothetical protein